MAIYLSKGQKVDLTKENPNLKNILIGIGWNVKSHETEDALELDTAVFLCGANGKCLASKDFIFYGNLEHDNGSIKHLSDNLKVNGEDDEQIQVDLSKMDSSTQKIAFAIIIYESNTKKQDFRQIEDCFIRIIDESTNTELLRYEIGGSFSDETSVVVGELYRYNGEWKFNAIGSGFTGGLVELCDHYGIKIK